jgi:hypothetical protein
VDAHYLGQEYFLKYYDQVMPLLFEIMVHAKDRSMLRAKCLECVSLIGMAVGRDRSREDAKKIMAMITQWQQDSDDPTFAYTLQAGARLCKCLGKEFLPYMDAVMPPLVNAASEENYFQVLDDDEDEEEDDDIATFQVGDKSLNIRISALEEKATACNMLRCYADELQEGFFRCGEALPMHSLHQAVLSSLTPSSSLPHSRSFSLRLLPPCNPGSQDLGSK